LDEKLTQLGFNLSSPIVYRAVELAVLPDKVKIEFNQRRVAIATFLSPLAAKIFVRLVSESMTTVDLSSTRAICISSNVVEQLKHLNWQTVETARHPNLEQVMALV
jgi:uroporphyrinogen-III synthase